jgi:hypothetical protein
MSRFGVGLLGDGLDRGRFGAPAPLTSAQAMTQMNIAFVQLMILLTERMPGATIARP